MVVTYRSNMDEVLRVLQRTIESMLQYPKTHRDEVEEIVARKHREELIRLSNGDSVNAFGDSVKWSEARHELTRKERKKQGMDEDQLLLLTGELFDGVTTQAKTKLFSTSGGMQLNFGPGTEGAETKLKRHELGETFLAEFESIGESTTLTVPERQIMFWTQKMYLPLENRLFAEAEKTWATDPGGRLA